MRTSKRMEKRGKRGREVDVPNTACDFCSGSLFETEDLVLKDNKTHLIKVLKCRKCGQSYSNLSEVERVRKELNPTLFEKIKRLFFSKSHVKEIDLFSGKVL